MSLMQSSNPALSDRIFSKSLSDSSSETMTVQGTVNKTLLMLLLVILGAVYTWKIFFESTNPSSVNMWMLIGGIGGFITSLVIIFKPKTSAYLAPVYSILQGLFLGGISAVFAAQYGGPIIMQAIALTFGTFLVMLAAYKTGVIKATQKFRTGVIAATGAIALVYFITWILSMFGVSSMGYIHGSGTVGIVIGFVVVIVAALNLILDFDFIEKGAAMGAPKHMEWYGAFGLMITLVWLYIEILKLLARFAKKN
ncbi:MAG: Bax inhibitor-1/YccA family protein [Bacteroidales bacterium]|nr:Bax inhibitor-1/YccA family protein [Bacteroidales bacterium]MBN2748814.1 Bax inhibitor-1/YccA family protein [Bacteroidales bacterium]